MNPPEKILVNNKKAYHEYFIMDKYVAGIALLGTEVKSLRLGKGNISDAWIDLDHGEAFLIDAHISHYSHGNQFNHTEQRKRKLLLKKQELKKLESALSQKGLTLVALKLFVVKQFIKLELATARGKKLYDKRDSAKDKTATMEMRRALKGKN